MDQTGKPGVWQCYRSIRRGRGLRASGPIPSRHTSEYHC